MPKWKVSKMFTSLSDHSNTEQPKKEIRAKSPQSFFNVFHNFSRLLLNDKLLEVNFPGEVVYTTSLSMVCEVSCKREKSVADLLHVPPNGYSPRPNVRITEHFDDIIITGNDTSEIEKFKEFLRTKFMIKDLGNLKYFLRIEVINTDKGICLNTIEIVLDLMTDYFMHAPLKSHLRSAFKILRYLTGSPGLGIHITKTSGMYLKAYSDTDWANCVVTRKSVIGYYFLTKGLDTIQHNKLVHNPGMINLYQI
ncbi:ribonuclease H-like domain-containing protein [Tanacetum coccineum]